MTEKQKRIFAQRLKKFALAYHAFNQVVALCDHLTEQKIKPQHPIYTPCLAGIAVTYMKQFVGGEGIGELPPEFRQFDDPLLQHTHDRLEESRHKVYAHRDVTAAASLAYDNVVPVKPYEIVIELSKEQPPLYLINAPDLNPDIGSAVRKLCVFQIGRTGTKMNDILNQFGKERSYKAGRYIIGEEFP